jgi:hypothetical protein
MLASIVTALEAVHFQLQSQIAKDLMADKSVAIIQILNSE